ncbi:hypothetical protein KA977_07165, partial [Candidatus Dependentiae bacterium]|nr:hypothetical protein [Candidatus Dependentiae bacterium]
LLIPANIKNNNKDNIIKTPAEQNAIVTEKINQSINIVKLKEKSEFRTTVYPKFVSIDDLEFIKNKIYDDGTDWFLQKYVCRPEFNPTDEEKKNELLSITTICKFMNIDLTKDERIKFYN